MKAIERLLIWTALATFVLAACASGATGPSTSAATGLQDDFSSSSCRFGNLQAGSTRGYECVDGEFRAWIDNDQASYEYVTSPLGGSYGDVRIDVDTRIVSAEPYGGAVILCRGSDVTGDYYRFTLSPLNADITDVVEGEDQISRFKDLPAGLLKPDDWNHVRVDCLGNHLAMYLNGTLVLDRDLDEFAEGDVALGAGGSGSGFTDIHFDNLGVQKP
jgi:hypothetical protein